MNRSGSRISDLKTASRWKARLLLLTIGFVAGSGLASEYMLGTYVGYILGGAFKQMTLLMTIFIFAMGWGGYRTRVVEDKLIDRFIRLQIAIPATLGVSILTISLLNGFAFQLPRIFTDIFMSSIWLSYDPDTIFNAYTFKILTNLATYLPHVFAFALGYMVGKEIPYVMRTINSYGVELKDNVSIVNSVDNFGALFGGVLWAFLLIYWPLTRSAFLLASINCGVAIVLIITFYREIQKSFTTLMVSLVLMTGLFGGYMHGESWEREIRQLFFEDRILYSAKTPYQSYTVTSWVVKGATIVTHYALFINQNLQFSTADEEKYHEGLVHPAMMLAKCANAKRVLVLGGGDGLALREIFHHPCVRRVDIVDLDRAITDFFSGRITPLRAPLEYLPRSSSCYARPGENPNFQTMEHRYCTGWS